MPDSPSLLIRRSTSSGRRRYRRRSVCCCRPRRPAPIRHRVLLLRPRATNRFSCNTHTHCLVSLKLTAAVLTTLGTEFSKRTDDGVSFKKQINLVL